MALLEGKTAVITGGSTGIGFATAKRFIDEGAYVFITGRRQAELDLAVKELGENAIGVRSDVSKAAEVDRLYAAVADSGRSIDIVFANAAILDVARVGEITEDQLDRQLGVDFKGVVFTVQKALPLLNDGGSIILNASNVAARGSDGIGVYAAIKAAVRSLARTWASELRLRNIRVNAVSPARPKHPVLKRLPALCSPGRTPRRSSTTTSTVSSRWDGSVMPTRSPTRCCSWPRS